MLTIEERFWKKVRKTSNCWYWDGTRNPQGYGIFYINRKPKLAHRISFLFFWDKDPGTLCVLHSCDTPACVNPSHLWLGTRKENQVDMQQKQRGTLKQICVNGHDTSIRGRTPSGACRDCKVIKQRERRQRALHN